MHRIRYLYKFSLSWLVPASKSFSFFVVIIFSLIFTSCVWSVKWIDIQYEVVHIFDDGDRLWLSTRGDGVFTVMKSDGTRKHLVAPRDIPRNKTSCVAVVLNRVWLGTDDGLYFADPYEPVWSRVNAGILPSDQINCLDTGNDELWVGTPRGAARLNSSGIWDIYTESDGLPDNWIMAINAGQHQVLFGTMRGGVTEYVTSSGHWRTWDREDGLTSNTVFSLSSSKHQIFVGTTSGFSVITPDNCTVVNYGSEYLPNLNVFSLTWSSELNQTWIGTGSGMAIWEEGQEMMVIDKVGEIVLGRINGLIEIEGYIWAIRQTTEWFSHLTTGILGFNYQNNSWLKPIILDVLVDQSGYEPGFPKSFIVQSNTPLLGKGRFTMRSGAGREVLSGGLGTRVDRDDWDAYYWVVDFSELNLRGNFSIEVVFGSLRSSSPRFEIDNGVLLDECGDLIYEFLRYMRCGVAHEYRTSPCHLDDGVLPNGTHIDVTGGWHCAGIFPGKYSEYTGYVLFNLLFARDIRPDFFSSIDKNENGLPDIIDEAMWGCDFLVKMQESNGSFYHEVENKKKTDVDGLVGTPDDRKIMGLVGDRDGLIAVAGLAGTAVLIKDTHPEDASRYIEAALRSFDLYGVRVLDYVGSSDTAAAMMIACGQLYRVNGNATYQAVAREYCNLTLNMKYSGFRGTFVPCSLGYYGTVLNPDTNLSSKITEYLVWYADERIASDTGVTSNLYPFEIPSFRLYQMDPEAAAVLFAYSFTGNLSYLEYGLRLIDCHLGVNPYGVCYLEGTGTYQPPGYASYFRSAENPRGAVPGSIPQGIIMKNGRPYYETSISPQWETGETWLINTNFLQTVALIPEDYGVYPLEIGEGFILLLLFFLGFCILRTRGVEYHGFEWIWIRSGS